MSPVCVKLSVKPAPWPGKRKNDALGCLGRRDLGAGEGKDGGDPGKERTVNPDPAFSLPAHCAQAGETQGDCALKKTAGSPWPPGAC